MASSEGLMDGAFGVLGLMSFGLLWFLGLAFGGLEFEGLRI